MRKTDRDLDRILTRLRNLLRERGFTQMEVQDALGWGRSYISQLLTKQKSLRLEQVLMILNVVDAKPEDFFGEIYEFGKPRRPHRSAGHAKRSPAGDLDDSTPSAELGRLRWLLVGLVSLLKHKGLITASDLARAIEKARHEP